MDKQQFSKLYFEQSKDLIWIIDNNFNLIEANPAFINQKEAIIDSENKISKPFLLEYEDKTYVDNWKKHYQKALHTNYFEFEKYFYHPITKVEHYCIVTITPLFDKNNAIEALTCQLKNISHLDKLKPEATILKNNFLDVFCTINAEGSFVFVSETAKTLWGYTPEELKYIPYRSLIVEEDLEKTDNVAQEVINGVEVTTFTNRYIRKDGGIAYNSWSARWDKELKLMFCIARNGKEQTEKEQSILQSEQRFKSLVQEGGDMISIIDLKGNYTYTSPTTSSILGITPEEFQGNNIADFIHPEDINKIRKYLKKIISEKKIIAEPFRLRDSNNNWRWIESVITNMLDNPAVEGIVANSRDITKKINEEHRLKLLKSVITNAKDAVLITEAEPFDEPGPRIIYVNDAFTKLTGYTAEEVIGKTPRILQGPNSDYEELAKLGKALRNWEPCEATTINYKKNGDEFWINFKITPVADEKGCYTHWVSIERDVTEQVNKTLENELTGAISEAFNQNNSLRQSSELLLEKMAEFGQFDLLELWIPNHFNKKTNLYSYKLKDQKDEVFYMVSDKNTSFKSKQGLQGTVWQRKKAIYVDDVENTSIFKRQNAAKKIGLKSVLGIPLLHQNEIQGVLLVGTKLNSSLFKKNKPIFKKLENFIGSEIHRKKLESNLKLLFDTIPVIISTGDFEGNFLKINKAGCEILGYKEHEIIGASFEEFMHPDDVEKSKNELASLIHGQETFNFETRFITKENKIVWLSWNCTPDFKNEVIYSIAKNITEEIKLKELNRKASEVAKIGSWELNLESQELFWSDQVHEIHGTDPVLYTPDLESALNFYRADFRDLLKKEINKAIATGESWDIEAVIITKQYQEKWVRAIGSPEVVEGNCMRLYGSFQDIHQSKILDLRLSDILNSISDAFYALDKHWNFTYFNKEAERLLKRKQPEVIHKNIWEAFPEAKESALLTRYERVFKTKVSETFEYLFPGDEIWHEISVYPSLEGLSVYFKSIDERKKSEQKLLQAFEEKNKILESIGDGFFSVKEDWTVTYWNKEAEHLTGIAKEDIVDQNFWDLYKDAVDTPFYFNYKKAMDERVKVTFEEFYPNLNKWFEVNAYPSNEGLSVYFKDTTQQKQIRLDLEEANDRFQKVTEATKDIIWDWDVEKNSFYKPEAIKHFFGNTTPLEVTKEKFWQDKFHPDDLVSVKQKINGFIKDPNCERWELEYRILNENKEIIYIIDRGIISRNSEGKAIRMVGSMIDVTEQKMLNIKLKDLNKQLQVHAKDLERSNYELEQFAFITSHDLQEPLRMVSSFMELLKRKYGHQLDDKALQYIDFATDGAKRMKQIILDLLEYSRAGRVTDAKEHLYMDKIIAEYKILRRKVIAEKSALIKHNKLPLLFSQKVVLTQIMNSLLDNAIKYSKKGVAPLIEISAKEQKNEWLFTVKDNGIGIDPKFFDKIFVIFQRLHDRSEYEGTGIGLSVTKKHVESLGGEIWLTSEEGIGTTFYFTILK